MMLCIHFSENLATNNMGMLGHPVQSLVRKTPTLPRENTYLVILLEPAITTKSRQQTNHGLQLISSDPFLMADS